MVKTAATGAYEHKEPLPWGLAAITLPRLGPLCGQDVVTNADGIPFRTQKDWLPEKPGVLLSTGLEALWDDPLQTDWAQSSKPRNIGMLLVVTTQWQQESTLRVKGKFTLSPANGSISCAQNGDEVASARLPGLMGGLKQALGPCPAPGGFGSLH